MTTLLWNAGRSFPGDTTKDFSVASLAIGGEGDGGGGPGTSAAVVTTVYVFVVFVSPAGPRGAATGLAYRLVSLVAGGQTHKVEGGLGLKATIVANGVPRPPRILSSQAQPVVLLMLLTHETAV